MPLDQQAPRSERRAVLLLAAVNLVALGSLTAPFMAGIPLAIDALFAEGQRAAALATVLAIGGASALIANPMFGFLSDRTRGRFGRRRPWMLGGAVLGLASVGALAMAASFPAIVISWICVQFAFNATLAAAAGLLADIVPEPRRAAASGIFTAAAFAGALPPLLLTAFLPRQVQLVSFVMPIIGIVVVGLAMTIRERPPTATAARPRQGRRIAVSPAFAAVWMQRLAMQSALSLTTGFTIYLVIDRMTANAVTATPTAMVATLLGGAGVVIGASVGGAWASRRRGYLPFLVCGAVGLAVAASVRAVADVPLALWVGAAVGGLSVGAYLAVNLAWAMRVIPAGRGGTYLGLLNVAETIPQVLTPLVAAALLRVGQGDPLSGAPDNYVMLYGTAAVIALLSLAALPALRRTASAADTSDADARGAGPHDADPDDAEVGATSSQR